MVRSSVLSKFPVVLWVILLSACNSASTHPKVPSVSVSTEPIILTPTISLTPASTLAPTFTPSPTLFSIPAAPTVDESRRYQLQLPDPQKLIEAAGLAEKQKSEYSYQYTEDPRGTFLGTEASYVLGYIDEDFHRYYANGLVGADLHVADHAVSLWGSIGIPGWVKTYLTGWAIQTINSQKIQFNENQSLSVDGVTFVPHPIDLNRDGEPEWFVEVSFERYYNRDHSYEYYTWLLLKHKADGSYSVLPNEIPITFQYADWDHPYIQLDLSHDLNGNGIKDVILSEMSYFAGGVSGNVYIYFWNGTNLSYVNQIRLPPINPQYGESYQSSFSVADSNQDGREEIHITWPRFAEFGCTWETTITYQWDGEKFIETSQNEDIPIESGRTECFISKALWSTSPEDKTFWFEEALRSLPPDASPDLVSWVHLRLMAAYLGQGKDAEAQQALQNLVKNKENGNFTEAVRKTIKSSGTSPLEVCKKIHDQASELAKEYQYFNSDIDGYLAYGGYPLSHEPGPNKVCPYDELPFDRLLSQRISAEINPVEGFGKAGFELRFAQTLNADIDPELEWLVFYEDRLTILDSISGKWRAEFIRNIENPISIQAVAQDITEDQLPEILVVAELSEPRVNVDGPCQTGDNNYSVMTIDLSKSGYERVDIDDYDCQSDPPPDLLTDAGVARLVSLAKDYGSNGQKPDWYFMVGLPGKPDSARNIDDYVRSIEKAILSGVDLDPSQSKIIALLEYIPVDDLQGLAMRHQLQYLLGLSYEIEGANEKAVNAYLELIRNAPDLAWSWLAWTRLKPITP